MKKLIIILTSIVILTLITFVYLNYPKLNLLSGYSAKYMNSSVFLAGRTADFTNKTDLNFSPVNLADNRVYEDEKLTKSSALHLLTREAIYRKGVGSVLILNDEDKTRNYLYPKRSKPDNTTPYPYGNADQQDTVFQNINYDKLNKSVSAIFNDTSKTRAVVVVYKDHIIAEKYDKDFNKNSKILGWSMTKSVGATIFGILQYQGKLDVQAKAPIKEWQNDARKDITISNLLQMNSGLEWHEDYEGISDATKMLFLSRNMGDVQRDKSLIGKPNETWNYSSGTSNLLSNILRMQFNTHQEYLDFWYSALIDKIGMNSMLIETDLDGNYVSSSYGWATPRDWAKLGLLYLHNGAWNGEQLFDKQWVDYATTPTPHSDKSYGAQIWLNAGGKYPDVSKSMYSFNGYQGQYVFILPESDLVVVRMGLSKKLDLNKFLKGIVEAVE